MYYKQLKDFFRQREQKAFWIFNYANIAGLFGGLFVGRFLADAVPWLPGPLLIPLVMLGGLSLTWQRQGRETYKAGWLRGRYMLRRIFASSSLVVHSAEHYRIEQTTIRPFSIAGKLAYSGEDHVRTSGRVIYSGRRYTAKDQVHDARSSNDVLPDVLPVVTATATATATTTQQTGEEE